ncbi:MAG: D-alanyl-D-alanine carboxypeptidase, partial [Clostridiales bacterium]|nr:D-alanyl-D-alanine carboxypeptidase [Clostridiales bacterium]
SATAERDCMELIAVVLKSPTSTQRFEGAKALLNFGFANYALMDVHPDQALPPIDVLLGETRQIQPVLSRSSRILLDKADVNNVTTSVDLVENVEAPVEAGQRLGEMTVLVNGEVTEVIPVVAGEAVGRIGVAGIFNRLLHVLFMAG